MNRVYEQLKYVYLTYIRKTRVKRSITSKFAHIGKSVHVDAPFSYCKLNNISIGDSSVILSDSHLLNADDSKIEIGNKCFLGYNLTISTNYDVCIDNNVLFASNISIASSSYNNEREPVHSDLKIGNGCWIGEKVCILGPVHIGEKSIIGAASVVCDDVPPYSIAVGNPAHVIKKYDFQLNKWVKA